MGKKIFLTCIAVAFVAIAAIASFQVIHSSQQRNIQATSHTKEPVQAATPAPSSMPTDAIPAESAAPSATQPVTQPASAPASTQPSDSQPAAAEGTHRKHWDVPVQKIRVRAVWRDTHAAATPTTVTIRSGRNPLREITDSEGFATFEFPQSRSVATISAIHKESIAYKADYTLPVNQPLILPLERGASVFGRVRMQGGKTVAGATATMPNGRKKDITDAEGNYVLSGLKPGTTVKVLAYWKEYISFDDVESVEPYPLPKAGVRYGPHDVFLKPGRAVIGTVTDAETKQPILNARVTVACQVREATALSNPAGFYRAGGLPKMEMQMQVKADGYANFSKRLTVSDQMERREDIQLEKGGDVDVLVVDEMNLPVAGASVYYVIGHTGTSVDGKTDATGHLLARGISIKNPPQLRASKEGYRGSDEVRPVFTSDGAVPQVKLTLRKEERKQGAFFGKVTDETGKPIVGATVQWTSPYNPQMRGASAGTDAEGAYTLTVSIREEGYGEQLNATNKGNAPAVSQEQPGTIEKPKEVNFQLDKGHFLKVDVVDSTGQVVKDPRYAVSWPEMRFGNTMLPGQTYNQRGDDNGHIEITDLPSPRVKIQIDAQNKSAYDETVEVDQTLKVELKDQGVLRGRVQDEQGRPVSKFKISGRGTRSWSMELSDGTEFNDPQGKFIFKSLDLNQTYTLNADAKGYGTDTKENLVPKSEAETEEILFTLKTAGQLRGIVVDAATGAPVSGAQIVYGVKKEQWSHFDWNEMASLNNYGWKAVQSQTSAADGSFSLDEGSEQGFIFIQPAQHARMIVAPADRSKYLDPQEALHIPLQAPASIAGRFTKNGQPVVGAELYLGISGRSEKINQQFGQVRTGSDGAFKWEGLAEGTYSLSHMIRSGNMGNNALTRNVELKSGEQKWIDLGADMGPYTLSGRVLENSQGVEGVHIILSPQFKSDYQAFGGYSQTEGQYKIEGLFPGTYQARLNKWNPQGGRSLFELNETIEIRGDMVHDFGAKPKYKVAAQLAFPPDLPEAEQRKYNGAFLSWAGDVNVEEMQKNPRQLSFHGSSQIEDGRVEFDGRFDGKFSLGLQYNAGGNQTTNVQISGTHQISNLNADVDLGVIQVPATGSVRLLMDFNPRPANLPEIVGLILQTADGKNTNVLTVKPGEMEQVLSPVAFGNYKAMLNAPAHRVEPPTFDVMVGPGQVPTIGFILSPDGWLPGYVASPSQPNGVTPTRITLTGQNGFAKTLIPVPAATPHIQMSAEDVAVGPSFLYRNLEAGTYQLTIEAAGYQTYTATKTVVPGQLNQQDSTIQLTPSN